MSTLTRADKAVKILKIAAFDPFRYSTKQNEIFIFYKNNNKNLVRK